MFSIEVSSGALGREFTIAELWERGTVGIVELDDGRLRAFFEEACRAAVLEAYPGAPLRQEEDRDWVQSARDLLQPMEVGARLFLAPGWRDDPTPPGRFRITVNPGMAFGTGVHETTRLMLEALEEFVRPGMKVLDAGTGSGILARAARLLGASRVYACDIDPMAVEIAGEGFVGSADAVRAAAVDLAMANISAEAIVRLAGDLMRVLTPGGILLASGFELAEVGEVRRALPGSHQVRQKGNWALVRVSC